MELTKYTENVENMAVSNRNEYIMTLFDPRIKAPIPDFDSTRTLIKDVVYKKSFSPGGISGSGSRDGFLWWRPNAKSHQLTLWAFEPAIGYDKPVYVSTLDPDEDLSLNYVSKRSVSGSLKVVVTGLKQVAAPFEGLLSGARLQDPPPIVGTFFATTDQPLNVGNFTTNRWSAYDMVVGVRPDEGIVSLASPDPSHSFITTGLGSAPNTGTTRYLRDSTVGPSQISSDEVIAGFVGTNSGFYNAYALVAGVPLTFWSAGVPLMPTGLGGSSNTFPTNAAPLPRNFHGQIRLTIDAIGTFTASAALTVNLYATVRNADPNDWSSVSSVSTIVDRDVPAIIAASNNKIYINCNFYAPPNFIGFIATITSSVNNTLTLTDATYSVVGLDAVAPGFNWPSTVIMFDSFADNTPIHVFGLQNYEVVPNSNISKQIPIPAERPYHMFDLGMAERFLNLMAMFQIGMVMSTNEYESLIMPGVGKIVPYYDRSNLAQAAGFFEFLHRVARPVYNAVRPFFAPAMTAVGTAIGGPPLGTALGTIAGMAPEWVADSHYVPADMGYSGGSFEGNMVALPNLRPVVYDAAQIPFDISSFKVGTSGDGVLDSNFKKYRLDPDAYWRDQSIVTVEKVWDPETGSEVPKGKGKGSRITKKAPPYHRVRFPIVGSSGKPYIGSVFKTKAPMVTKYMQAPDRNCFVQFVNDSGATMAPGDTDAYYQMLIIASYMSPGYYTIYVPTEVGLLGGGSFGLAALVASWLVPVGQCIFSGLVNHTQKGFVVLPIDASTLETKAKVAKLSRSYLAVFLDQQAVGSLPTGSSLLTKGVGAGWVVACTGMVDLTSFLAYMAFTPTSPEREAQDAEKQSKKPAPAPPDDLRSKTEALRRAVSEQIIALEKVVEAAGKRKTRDNTTWTQKIATTYAEDFVALKLGVEKAFPTNVNGYNGEVSFFNAKLKNLWNRGSANQWPEAKFLRQWKINPQVDSEWGQFGAPSSPPPGKSSLESAMAGWGSDPTPPPKKGKPEPVKIPTASWGSDDEDGPDATTTTTTTAGGEEESEGGPFGY